MTSEPVYNPTTDPYAQAATEEEHPDRLGQGPSTTPLMTGGAGGWIRIGVLMFVAALFAYGKSNEKVRPPPVYGGLTFPNEIQIYGLRQSALGGGKAPFGALGFYVRMTPEQVQSPPQPEWAALDEFAKRGGQLGDTFFDALTSAQVEKSLLLQFNGEADASNLFNELDKRLSKGLGLAGAAAVVSALQGALKDAARAPLRVPPAGAQLYVTCDRMRNAHIAYGSPAEGDHVRNTASVSSSLKHKDVPAVCQTVLDAMLGFARKAKDGVAKGFVAQYGPPQGRDDQNQKTEL